MKWIIGILILELLSVNAMAQQPDTSKNDRFSVHAQTTVISQSKPSFNAKYTGDNSLLTQGENQTSITATLFAGTRLWKGASLFINPEIAGGAGLSQALGVAAATNGETFRVGDPAPKIYLARLFYRQIVALTKETGYQQADFNQLDGNTPLKYFAFTIGKIGSTDYFDNNKFSHDPRTQFMSWALMANGAWDYPANTRGYTPAIVLEFVTPQHELRYGAALVAKEANGNDMNWNISKASSHTIEYTHKHKFAGLDGAIRILGFFTTANLGNYKQSIALSPVNPEIEETRQYGNTKFGFGLNMEQKITSSLGCFARAGWNDGRNETWAFTEIDHSLSFGLSMAGERWKRAADNAGLAYVASGISKAHEDYLKAGGKGFMLGDGNLNYGWEHLTELFYAAELVPSQLYLTGAYQFLLNPGYNKDRHGPVHVFSVRLHARI
ncbi:carbohydrate porin [Filimonas effusa]|uniref:Carbohydrate porin n=1 Tax=Filimonas effusa TaxID=2508721 RepID=A0A4Q1DAD7_9BACT|nr:carbohydrate porin [Filimonas effusa]RXK86200.1 carbohydrate porin [Filimonas effusa]